MLNLTRNLCCVAAMLVTITGMAADLSPEQWPLAERAKLQEGSFFSFPRYAGIVKGNSMLVSGTASPVAVHAGIEALRQGGTAADAVATVALTQIVDNLGSAVSYAGISQLVYFDAATHRVYALDAGWGTYAHETHPESIPPTDDMKIFKGQAFARDTSSSAFGRQTLVPGFMAGIEALHAKFGRLPFKDLFEPAIWYARNGVVITPAQAYWLRQRQSHLWRTPEGHRFASMPDGHLPEIGDLFRQPDLARTLQAIAGTGATYMYTGEWAKSFIASVRAEGGQVTAQDLARYRPVWREPLTVPFEGAIVFGPGEDASGQCPTLEALNLLSGLHIEAREPYWRDPTAFKTYADVLRLAADSHYSDRIASFDTAHGFTSCHDRLTPRYAAAGRQLLSLLSESGASTPDNHHTEAVVAVDRRGNVAALAHSMNTVSWGDTGIVVGGIPIADAAAINRAALRKLTPGEMVPNGMSPVIALKDGKPVLAVATVGYSLVQETTRVVSGVLTGQDLLALMSAPPLLLNMEPPEDNQNLAQWPEAIPAGSYDRHLLQQLPANGVHVREVSIPRAESIRGTAVFALLEPGGSPRTVEVPSLFGFAESDLQQGAPKPAEAALTTASRSENGIPPPADIGTPPSASSVTETSNATGDWIGYLSPDVRLAFHIHKIAPGVYQGTADSPDYGSFGFPVQKVSLRDETLSLRITSIGALYEAHWDATRQHWDGQWQQNGATVPLKLNRGVFPAGPTVTGLNVDWEGDIATHEKLGIHIETNAHGTVGKLALPDRGLFDSPVSSITRQDTRITLKAKFIGATITGQLSSDATTIAGNLTAFGVTTPLTLTRAAQASPSRPRAP